MIYRFLLKRGQLKAILLGTSLTVIYLLIVGNGISDFNMLSPDDQENSNLFNFGLYAGLWLVRICAILWIFFTVYQLVTHFKMSVKGLIGGLVLLGLFLLMYSIASPEATGSLAAEIDEAGITTAQSKLISGGLMTMLALAGVAIVTLVLSEIANLFK